MYAEYFTAIWSQIQQDIFNNASNDLELESKSFQTLTAVISKLPQSNLKFTLSNIVDTLIGNLNTVSKFQAQSKKILYHVATASHEACTYVFERVAPTLVAANDLTALVLFAKPCIEFNGSFNENLSFIPNMCLKAAFDQLSGDDVRVEGLNGLSELSDWVPEQIRKQFYVETAIFLMVPKGSTVGKALLNCYQAFAKKYVLEVKNHILSKLELRTDLSIARYVEALVAVAHLDDYAEIVLPTLVELCINDYTNTVHLAVYTLNKLLQENEPNYKLFHYIIHETNAISKISFYCMKSSNLDVSISASAVLKLLVGSLSNELQRRLVLPVIETAINGYRTNRHSTLLVVLSGLMLRLHPDVLNELECGFVQDLLLFEEIRDLSVRDTVMQLLANLLNKYSDISLPLKEASTIMRKYADDDIGITLCVWITKGLLMRGHEEAYIWMKEVSQKYSIVLRSKI